MRTLLSPQGPHPSPGSSTGPDSLFPAPGEAATPSPPGSTSSSRTLPWSPPPWRYPAYAAWCQGPGLTHVSCQGPDGDYFRLCGRVIAVTATRLLSCKHEPRTVRY